MRPVEHIIAKWRDHVPASPQPAHESAMTCQNDNTPIKVLVIEDDDIDRAYVEYCLLQSEFPVDVASSVSSVDEARQAIYTNTYELIVLDYNLTDGTAISVLNSIVESGTSCPILLISGMDHDYIRKLEIHDRCFSLEKINLSTDNVSFVLQQVFS